MANNSFYANYKEAIDLVYSLTSNQEYKEGFNKLGSAVVRNVVTELVRRGVLKKTHYPMGGTKGFHYGFQWIAPSAPTNNFVKSVADAIRARQREYLTNERRRKRTQASAMPEAEMPPIPAETQTPSVDAIKDYIDHLTDQELWDILKRRGAAIRNNRLVIVREFELE